MRSMRHSWRISPATVLITGCGPTGLFAAAVARTAGAATIIATDISDYRLGLAKRVESTTC